MYTVLIAQISILVFAGLVLVGGYIGFKKAKSKASLIASTLSALALICCFCFQGSENHLIAGFKATFLLIGLLEGIFIVRLIKTKKFMPSGLMLIFCGIEQSVLFYVLKNI